MIVKGDRCLEYSGFRRSLFNTVWVRFFGDMSYDHKDAINRRLYNNQSFVETAIYRVSCLNRTLLDRYLAYSGFRRSG
ncbi:MAG: hypothetical protein V7K69_18165 [Nostoc sp.]|uniref:hypothetical protein n=1 Tax=Nostoc sp. TaxID=1180 RepID=UPI002FFB2927